MRTSMPLLLLLSACVPGETGIDTTVLTGTITIPPAAVSDSRGNDEVASAQPLGADGATGLTWRSVVVTGAIEDWPSGLSDRDGDPDNFAFTPVADGVYTFDLSFATTTTAADTASAGSDADVLSVQIIDPSAYDADTGAGVLLDTTTDGSGGVFSTSFEVSASTTYVLRLAPGSTDDTEAELAYSLVVSGSAPDDATILVGAYVGADPKVAENPVGGTNAVGWTYDAATHTWNGTWKMMWLRQVVAVEDTDTDDLFQPNSEVTEGPATVYVRAGSLTSLNAGPAAGALYTTASVEAASSGTETALESPLVLDGVAPKIIGVQATETLPDTTLAEIDLGDYTLNTETLVAQDLGMLSGLGYVDIVAGSSLLDPTTSGWNGSNDSDAFAFTVPATANVRMKASWADTTSDLDFGIWYADPDYGVIDLFSSWGDTYCLSSSNPEVCESAITLEPDVTYYLVALGYVGSDDEPYSVELEWLAP